MVFHILITSLYKVGNGRVFFLVCRARYNKVCKNHSMRYGTLIIEWRIAQVVGSALLNMIQLKYYFAPTIS